MSISNVAKLVQAKQTHQIEAWELVGMAGQRLDLVGTVQWCLHLG